MASPTATEGARSSWRACSAGASLAYLTLGLAQTLADLVLAVVLAGGAGGTLATAQAYIADSTGPKDRARGLGLIGAAFGLGLMAGPALGGLLSLHSLGAPAIAASALANAVFGYLILPESHPPRLRKRVPILRLNPVSQLAGALRVGNVRALLLAVLLINVAFTRFPNHKPA